VVVCFVSLSKLFAQFQEPKGLIWGFCYALSIAELRTLWQMMKWVRPAINGVFVRDTFLVLYVFAQMLDRLWIGSGSEKGEASFFSNGRGDGG